MEGAAPLAPWEMETAQRQTGEDKPWGLTLPGGAGTRGSLGGRGSSLAGWSRISILSSDDSILLSWLVTLYHL